MPVSPAYRPDPQFAALGPEFSDAVRPADFPAAVPRWRNRRWDAQVGLDTLDAAEWEAAFARFAPLPGQPGPLAMRYHGHQFRHYNPDLGDGRGFLAAQLRARDGRLLDLATKGSGTTPWSRAGDGRLTLKGGVREVLAAEMLEALGVPTSKAFALFETGEALTRGDEPSPTRSSVLTRLSWSHVRFGTFQRHAFFDSADRVTALVEHGARLYYPELDGTSAAERPAALLHAVVGRTARLVAAWMAAGFVHGVLNTDNMNLTGESFDYGPYRFLPKNDPNFTAAYFDTGGLYAFGRQPSAVFWNLQQLAACLTLATDDQDALLAALNTFSAAYREALAEAMARRLGVAAPDSASGVALAESAFALLAEEGEALGWEGLFFDWFGGEASRVRAMEGPRAGAYRGAAAEAFQRALTACAPDRPERSAHAYFARPQPETLLYDEIEALWSAIAERDDWGPFEAKLAAIGQAREAYALAEPLL